MIKKYKTVYLLGFQNALEYRSNYFMNLISIFFPIMMQYFVWRAVYSGKAENTVMFGLTYNQAMIYTLCAGFIAKIVSTGLHYQISQDIKSGGLNQFLVRPVKYIGYQAFRFLGEKTSEFVVVFILMFIFLLIAAPILGLKMTAAGFFMFLIAIIPAMILNFLLFLSVSMIAFWIVEVGRLYAIIDILIAIVSGNIFPLSIFGDTAIKVFRCLPFSYTTYFLTNLVNGTTAVKEFLLGLMMQLLWIVVLGVLCSLIWKRGMKKYVAVGG